MANPKQSRKLALLGLTTTLAMMHSDAPRTDSNGFGRSSRVGSDPKAAGDQVKGDLTPVPKGHKEFIIDGKIVYALNEKNAIKKAKRK